MDKHYSIDPGRGEKMDGCPYSIYEDGHDVKDYIIPPKGYIFTGFRFEPLTNNQIYDGKLVAQFEKASIQERLTSNLWKILIPIFIVAVVTAVVLLAVSIFRDPKPKPAKPTTPTPQTETIVPVVDTLITPPITPSADTTPKTDSVIPEETNVIPNLSETIEQQTENQQVEEKPQPADDPIVQFKKEFWDLIHQRTIMMDPYHELYVNYKDKASGEEYDYLRLVILKDYASFKEWYSKLHQLTFTELENINTIADLKSKLNTIELQQLNN